MGKGNQLALRSQKKVASHRLPVTKHVDNSSLRGSWPGSKPPKPLIVSLNFLGLDSWLSCFELYFARPPAAAGAGAAGA
jgi:hypothetical protein